MKGGCRSQLLLMEGNKKQVRSQQLGKGKRRPTNSEAYTIGGVDLTERKPRRTGGVPR